MSKKLVSWPAMAQILGISHKRFQQLADEGVFKKAEAEGSCTIDEIAGELNEAFSGGTILSGIDLRRHRLKSRSYSTVAPL